jgi:hypothetical protein
MEFKSLLNISYILIILLVVFACEDNKGKTQVEVITHKNIEKKEKVDSSTIKIFTSNDTNLTIQNNSIKENVTSNNSGNDNNLYKKDKQHSETEQNTPYSVIDDSTSSNDVKLVHNGVGYKLNELYLVYPESRIRDSINLFVDNYERLMRRLEKNGIGRTNKPIKDPIKRDSLLWVEWQKIVKQNDYRHKHVTFDRNTMKFGKKK